MKRFSSAWSATILFCAAAPVLSAQTPPQTPAAPAQTPAAPLQTPAAPAQTPPPAEQTTAAPQPPPPAKVPLLRHVSVGLRATDFPSHTLSAMTNQTILTTTAATPTQPITDWNFTTTNHSPVWGVGPAFEYAVSDRLTFTLEFMWNKLKYTKETSAWWGTTDPTQVTDLRNHYFVNEQTKANLFTIPLMVHYRGLRPTGPFSKLFVGAGVTARAVSSIRSAITITNPDTSTETSSTPVVPSKRDLLGGVASLGLRVTDDFGINWTPEVRYTRWAGSTFGQDSTVSPRNQFEVGLGITF
jgi:hypothetical protein